MRRGKKPEFKLTKTQVRRLEQARLLVSKTDPEWDRRIRGVLLVGRDRKSRKEAAEMCEVSERTLYEWQSRFESGGVDALMTGQAPGRAPRLQDSQREELAKCISSSPEELGFDTGIWTSASIASLVQDKFGIEYSPSQIRRILRQLSFSYQVPKTRLAKADPDAQAVWQDEKFPELLRRARDDGWVIFF